MYTQICFMLNFQSRHYIVIFENNRLRYSHLPDAGSIELTYIRPYNNVRTSRWHTIIQELNVCRRNKVVIFLSTISPAVQMKPKDVSHWRARPPSTGNSIPVIKEASSLAKNAAAFPISVAFATRPMGIPLITTARPSSLSVPPSTLAIIPVSAATGQMALHQIPSFANSAARPFVTAETAPLEPAYQTRFGRGRGAEIEERLTKTPCPCFLKCG